MSELKITVSTFDALSPNRLYGILRLRAEVFVVEQECAYLDPDGQDQAALHVCIDDADGLAAYLRILPGDAEDDAIIGRVVSRTRRRGLGMRVMQAGIEAAADLWGARSIRLAAQVYARAFYERLGFCAISEPFLEDGIAHVWMRRDETAQACISERAPL